MRCAELIEVYREHEAVIQTSSRYITPSAWHSMTNLRYSS